MTFEKSYMESLSDGAHEFELVYRDGSVKATMAVTSVTEDNTTEGGNASDEDATTEDSTSENGSASDENTDGNTATGSMTESSNTSDDNNTAVTGSDVNEKGYAAATGDNSYIAVWIALLAVCSFICVCTLYGKKRK